MDKKWLITLGSLTVAAATTATVGAFILTGDPSSGEEKELTGVQEPAFDGSAPAFDTQPDGTGATTGNPDDGVSIVRDGDSSIEVPIGRYDQDGPKDAVDETGDSPPVDPISGPPVREDGAEPSIGIPEPTFEYMKIFQLAQDELSQRLGIDKDSIRLAAGEGLTWSDTSLGNPEPGKAYDQALVPGFKLVLAAQSKSMLFVYHTSMDRVAFVESVEAAEYESGQLTQGDPVPNGASHGKVIPLDKLTEVSFHNATSSGVPSIEVEPVPAPVPELEPASPVETSVAG